MTPIFRSIILQNIDIFYLFCLLQFHMPVLVSYRHCKCFLGREMDGFSTDCICKTPENIVFWIICIFVSWTQKAAGKEIHKVDPILAQLQKYSERSLLSLFRCCACSAHQRWLALYSLPFSVTPLQHLQFSSSCSLWVFSGKKQILLFRKHLLSLHIILLLPDVSNEIF